MLLRPVLIAALSARALAQSARRAGYEPIVLDAFGDEDTRAAAAHYERHSRAARDGFIDWRVKSFNAYWSRLKQKPALVLGTGFEDKSILIQELEKKTQIAGCGWRAVRNVKNPETFFAALDKLGIAHPETRRDAPSNPAGWLKKQIGASGGAHITTDATRGFARPDVYGRVTGSPAAFRRRFYYQRRISGASISLLGVASAHGLSIVGFSRQWASPFPRRPFRYGGAVGPIELPETLAANMRGGAQAANREFGLAGLVSFDFFVDGDTPYLLEVNPRPGSTLDIFDDEHGSLFSAHMEACLGSLFHIGPPRFEENFTTNVLDSPPPSLPHKGGGTASRKPLGDSLPLVGKDRVGGIPALENQRPAAPTRNKQGIYAAPAARAAAYLYADRGSLTFPKIDWPEWTADRPAPGARIPPGHPVATVFAEGATADAAEALCRKRLGLIEEMIYEPAQKTLCSKRILNPKR